MTSPPAPVVFAEPEVPLWGFGEVFVMAGLFLAAAAVVVGATGSFVRGNVHEGLYAVLQQFVVYGILFAGLYLITARHGEKLMPALGWVPHGFEVRPLIFTGFTLSVIVVLMQVLLRTPEVQTPFEKMLHDPLSRAAIALFGITLGPVVEELLFRGFLQPVLVNALGVLPGILTTSALFGALHLAQNANLWQSGVLIMMVGFVLGTIRHISGSTRASAVAHIAYNSIPFVMLLMQGFIPESK